ncbi:FAD-binding oxidoreductase [Rhizobium puerariae]|uniref:FAD-binding oxidoreductase n=1 Tax=Rhizobium puerariae TaxID=1585791 RepID=A0ABV6AEF5_9HYPH
MKNAQQIEEALAELSALLGASGYLGGYDERKRHSRDTSTARSCLPIAVLRPGNTEEVAGIMRVCQRIGMPVVPQGGLTGLSGGAVPTEGSVALSLERMNGVIEVDAENASLTAWAGTPLETVQEAARCAGFEYPVDIGARGSATIGGTIATNAGGIRVVRHGMTRQHLLGLEAVLPDASVIRNLRPMLKDNAGFDLKHMFVGSEGCLGVITRAVLRLSPAPHDRYTVLLGMPGYEAAIACLASARRHFQAELTAFEGMWPAYWSLACRMVAASRPPLGTGHGIYILMETSSRDRGWLEEWLEDCLEAGVVSDGVLADSLSAARTMWSVREAIGDVDREIGAHLNFDIGLAPSQLGEFAEACEKALGDLVTRDILHLGHIADGNLHVIVPVPAGDEVTGTEVERRLFDLLAERGGSVAAEHGIGTLKRPWIDRTRSADEISLMRVLKAAMDPKGILNPGKVIP